METIKKRIANALKNSLKKMGGVAPLAIESLLESPPDSTLGDLAFPCFSLAKRAAEISRSGCGRTGMRTPEGCRCRPGQRRGTVCQFFLNARALAALANSKTPKRKKQRERLSSSTSPRTRTNPCTWDMCETRCWGQRGTDFGGDGKHGRENVSRERSRHSHLQIHGGVS